MTNLDNFYVPEELTGYGTLLQYYDPITAAWTTIAGTQDLEMPEDTVEAVETTHGDGDGWGTTIPDGVQTLQPVTYTLNYRRSQFGILQQFKHNRRILLWRLVMTQTAEQIYLQLNGFITSIKGAMPLKGLVTSDVTIQPTGAPSTGRASGNLT